MTGNQTGNFFGYSITDAKTDREARNVIASFGYKGYRVTFATIMEGGEKVSVHSHHVWVGEYGTVEAACAAIDEMLKWGAPQARTWHRTQQH